MGDEDARTIWCGNLSEQITEDILYELFLQAGPLQKVSIPKDRDGKSKSFGFVTYKNLCSVPYALDLFEGTALFNRSLNLKSRNNSLMATPEFFPQPAYNSNQFNIQNELQLGQQVLLGNKMGFAQSNMFNMMPNSYPSQNFGYSQNIQNMDYPRNNNRHYSQRNHPYNDRDNYNNRHNHRQESYNKREHKSHKSSSHRSDRHDSRRKYR